MEPNEVGVCAKRVEDGLDELLNGAEVGGVPAPERSRLRLKRWLRFGNPESRGRAARPVWTAPDAAQEDLGRCSLP